MISRLVAAREWASRLFVSIVIVAAIAKDHVFEAFAGTSVSTGMNAPHVEVAYVLALIFIYAILEVGVELAIDHSRSIRRIFMADEDIEGYWLNIVFHSDRILSGGLIYIYYEDGIYKIEGRDFDDQGVWTGWFATELSRYESRRLSYKYRALRPGPTEDGTGHGEYDFTGGGHRHITQFDGFFFEDRNSRRFYVHGERLSDFVGKKDLRTVMDAVKVPLLVARFVSERKGAMPIAPVVDGVGHETP